MKLQTDQTMTIPPIPSPRNRRWVRPSWLRSAEFTAAVIAPLDPLAEAIAASDRQDRAVAQALLLHTDTTAKEREAEQAADRKARKKAEQERLTANKLKQREVFRQHFKWDHES